MKTGIYLYFGYEMEMHERIDLIKKTGFESVMVWAQDEDLEEVVKYSREQGLYVSNAHLPFNNGELRINTIWEEGSAGDLLTDELCRLVKRCGEISIPAAVFHVSSSFTPPPFNMLGIERIRRVVKVGEESGVDIAFENLRRIDYLQYVYDNITSPRAKFCYDCGHHNYLCPETNLLEMFGDRLVAVHLHDNFGDYDWHMIPFDGKVDFESVARGLAKAGYEGPVSLEVHQEVHERYKDYTLEQYITEAYESAVRLKEKIEHFCAISAK